MHVFLSPHLDDVVLSCGATIAHLKQQGETVVLLTAMAGEPPDDAPETPLVRTLRERFEGVKKALVTRRQEDVNAAMCLGVKVYHLAVLPSTFRCAPTMDGPFPLYPDESSQYGDIHPADDARVSLLAMPLPFHDNVTCIYAPLGVGHHVDHQLVRDWGLVLGGARGAPPLRFYAEYPYAMTLAATEKALAYYEQNIPSLRLRAEIFPMTDELIILKQAALHCYSSKVNTAWETMVDIERIVQDWTAAAKQGQAPERLWLAIKGTGMLTTPFL
jgi:LmbE family N-acetylglucosaminyl deacetylase